jgi:CcmD family protein
MNSFYYLFSAYTIFWLTIFLYTLGLSRRQRSLEDQIAEIREVLRKGC